MTPQIDYKLSSYDERSERTFTFTMSPPKFIEINGFMMTIAAYWAMHAALNVHVWGRYAARRFCANQGVSPRLYRIARQCEAMKKINRRIYD